MKKKLVLAIVLLIGIASFVYSGTVTKGLMGKQDFYLWYTVSSESTFERAASTGHTLTLNVIDWPGIDCLQIYGGGVRMTDVTLSAAITDLTSGNTVALWLAPETWTISDDITFPSNVYLVFPPGAKFSVGSGYTVTIYSPDHVVAQSNRQVFDGKVKFTTYGTIHPAWYGAVIDGSTSNQTLLDTMCGYFDSTWKGAIEIPVGMVYTPSSLISSAPCNATIRDLSGVYPSHP